MNTRPEQIDGSGGDIYRARSNSLLQHNDSLFTGFLNNYESDKVKRTHLFNGRYENIYLNENHIPELSIFLEEACEHANAILGTTKINAGYWFNYMPAGAVTLPHRHDDDDELLSGVYYVAVPENSGDLIIHADHDKVRISPEKGMFVFFKPDVIHEVTENLSQSERLSIGINFGIRTPGEHD